MEPKKTKNQVNVIIPKDAEVMFDWLRDYDPDLNSDAKVAAYLIKLGAEKLTLDGLSKIEPLEDEVYDALAERSVSGIKQAAG